MAEAVTPLPEGFVLDQPPAALPDGFVLDTPQRNSDDALRKALATFKPDEQSPTLADAIVTGAKKSVFGTIASRGEQEQQQAFNWYQRAAQNITSLAADAPFMVLGAVGGGVVGAPAGPGGVVVGAGAGSFALPEALRQVMIEGYGKGWFKDWGDFWTRLTAATLQTGKSAALGAVIGPAGAAGKAIVPAVAPAIAKTGAELAAQVTTMSTLGAAMEGHIPGWQDFLDNAILLGAAKGVMHVAGTTKIAEKLGKTYADTGMTPEQVRAEAERNPTIIQDLASDNRPVPEALDPWVQPQEAISIKQRIADSATRTELESMGRETGWAQRGGQIIRERMPWDTEGERGSGEVTGRSEWIANADWWPSRPKGLTEAQTIAAVNKALNGEPLRSSEQRTINYMLEIAEERTKSMRFVATAEELAAEKVPDADALNAAMVSRAAEINDAAVERMAMQHSDTSSFMQAVKEFLDANDKPGATAEVSAARPATTQAAEAATQSVGERVREAVRAKMGGGGKPPEPPTPPSEGMEGRSDAEKSVLSRLVSEVEQPKKTVTERLHGWYIDFIDRYHAIMQAQGGKAPEGEIGPYEATRLTAGTFGKVKQFIENGPFDARTYDTNAPSYKSVLDMVKADPKGFEAYIVAKHSIEREAAGKATGIDQAAAKQVVADGAAKFEAAAQARIAYKEALLDYGIKSGLISEESAAAMRDAYKAHVPLYRVFEGEERPMTGKTPRSPVKRATGSERLIIDPIASDIRDTALMISLAEKNMARQALVELGPEFAQKMKTKMRPVEITDQEMVRALKEQGVDAEAEGFTAFRPQSYNAAPNEIVVFENGKRSIYKVDPEVARAYNGADVASASLLTGMLRGAASWLRAGVTLSPDFSPRNVMRDALTAFIYAGSHPLKTAKGAISYFKEDAAYQNWLKGGGANAAMVSMDRRYIEQHLYDMEPQTHLMGRAWNVIKSPIEALRIVSETMENVTRLGIARDELMVAKDKAQIQALSMLTREGTVDFARHGADPFFRQWQLTTAFMNPAIQGLDRMVRAFKDNPAGTTAKALAAITIPSLLLWWKNRDDPRWKDIPDWERDLFWIVFTNKWEKPENDQDLLAHAARGMAQEVNGEALVNKGYTFRLPKPFEIGVLFGSVPERILDAYVADKPDAFKHFGKTLGNVFGINAIPTALLPPLQQMTNYNFFTDRPLVPDSMKALLPEYQYAAYTTEATKALGAMIGTFPGMKESSFASPMVIDNYIRGWSGTLGDYAMQIASAALEKAGVLPEQVKPTKSLAEYPVIKAFMIRDPSAQAQSIQDFYDHYQKSTQRLATIRHEAMLGHMDAVIKEMSVNPVELEKLESIHKALGQATHVIQFVQANPQITPDEKRQIIDATYGQMIYMARTGNIALQTIKKAMDVKPTLPKELQHAPAEMMQ